MLYDALTLSLSPLTFGRDPACPLCGDAPAITTLSDPVYACHQPPEDAEVSEDWELTVAELQSRLADVILIDVRETLDATALPEARHLPLSTLAAAIPGLPEDRDLVLVCQSGAASAQAVQLLRSAGFSRTWHLRGGLVAWHHLTGR